MRFVIDMQGAQSASRFRGIGNYTRSLVSEMARQKGAHDILLAVNSALPGTVADVRRHFGSLLGQDRIVEWQTPSGVAGLDPTRRTLRHASEVIRERFLQSLSADGLLMTTHFEGFVDDTVTSIGRTRSNMPTSVIAYDLIPAVYPETYLSDSVYRSFYEEKLAQFRLADQFLCISKSTRDEVKALLSVPEDRLHVIHAGVNPTFFTVDRAAALSGSGRTLGEYILYPGGLDARKNLQRLIQAFGALNGQAFARLKLVIVGQVELADQAKIRDWSNAAGLDQDRIVLTGFVSDSTLVSYYACARLVVFPSFHEGFGLPLLEAMTCETPVIGADAPGTREILSSADAMFDPHSTKAMTELIAASLTDDALRQKLVANGHNTLERYSWNQSATLALNALSKLRPIAGSPTKVTASPRLAYVSPLPPERTGIADYSAELLPALAAHYTIDAIVIDPDNASGASIPAEINIISAEHFAANAHAYDRIVYHVGNSPFHTHMFGLLQRYPGVVVLHDQYLGSFLRYAESAIGWQDAFWKALYTAHGWPALIHRASTTDTETIDTWPASREVIDRALGVLTHSTSAKRIAQRFYGEAYSRHWRTIHFPRLVRPKPSTATGNDQKAKFRVSTFGFVDSPKCPIELINGWALTPMSQREDCELVFVGENEGGEFGKQILDHISALGLEQSVRITGFVDEKNYAGALGQTDIAIQLRKVTRGETSAAVFDCLSAGLPLIVNNSGAMAELPEDVVYRIPETVTPDSISEALTALWQDPERAQEMAARAFALVAEAHAPKVAASEMQAAIESFYAGDGRMAGLTLKDLSPFARALRIEAPGELLSLAEAVATNRWTLSRQRTLFVDISAIAKTEKLTGMERTSRAILEELLRAQLAGWRVEPVVATPQHGYRIASEYLCKRYGIPRRAITDAEISPAADDTLLVLDWQPEISKVHRAARAQYRDRGVRIVFFVFDLLPLLHPEWFPGYVHDAHAEWMKCIAGGDGAICITRTVSEDLRAELQRPEYSIDTSFEIGWLHLGSDIQQALAPSTTSRSEFESWPFALMVGTVEPRKGYRFVVDAFERAWAEGEHTRLVIVGGAGWMVDDLVTRLSILAETEPRFTWHRQASDTLLSQLYQTCVGLIMASEGEGFGLPLIEAARFGRPLLVRDIPVFREVCGQFATYFAEDGPLPLARTLRQWIAASSGPEALLTGRMPVLTWSETTNTLISMLSDQQHPQWLPPASASVAGIGIQATQTAQNRTPAAHSEDTV